MVRARLHIICGNCGCNDMFKYKVHPEVRAEGEVMEPLSVAICCGNCSTIHTLSSTVEEEEGD